MTRLCSPTGSRDFGDVVVIHVLLKRRRFKWYNKWKTRGTQVEIKWKSSGKQVENK